MGAGEETNVSGTHLTADDLAGFRERRLDAPRVQAVFAHLSACALCQSTWQQALDTNRSIDRLRDDLAVPGAGVRRMPRRRLLQALAAGLLLAVIGALLLLLRTREPATTPEVVQTTPPPATATAPPSSAIAPEERPVLDPVIADAFARAALTPPPALAALLATPAHEHVRGSDETTGATYQPNREVVATRRPRFRFPAERGVPTVVRVFDRDREVLHSPPVGSGEWTPSTDLPRGVTYTWQVESTRDGEPVIGPAPPAPPARFIVLDADSWQTLETARREHPENHLLLGILAARAGLREDAQRELRAAAQASPDPRIPPLLHSIESW